MNLQSAKIRNLQKHGSVLLFILILLFSFVLLNMAAGLMFADSKLDEVVLIYSKATAPEKQEGYKMLSNLYPALTTRMESLKK